MSRLMLVMALVCMGMFLSCVAGCSSGHSPLMPPGDDSISAGVADELRVVTTSPGHNLLGLFSISFDAASGEFAVLPDRDALHHYNVTKWLLPPECNDCFIIELIEIIPEKNEIHTKITIKNPFNYTGYDVRGIFMHEQPGWLLDGASGYTSLFDDGGPITINPFHIFYKSIFGYDMPPMSIDSRHYGLVYPPGPDFDNIKYAVEGSWPTHCEDVRSITVESDPPTLDYDGGNVGAEVELWDWQHNVASVKIDATEIAGGIESFVEIDQQHWDVNFHADGTSGGASPGWHRLLITARSGNTNVATYTYLDVFLNPLPPPVDITPEYLNFGTKKLANNSNRLVAMRNRYAMDIFDVTDGGDPVWASFLQLEYGDVGLLQDIAIDGDRVYVADMDFGLHVVDISDIYNPQLLGTIGPHNVHGIAVGKERVFVHNMYGGTIFVYDTTPASLPVLLSEFDVGQQITSMAWWNNYLYFSVKKEKLYTAVLDDDDCLQIVNMQSNYPTLGYEGLAGHGDYLYCFKDVGTGYDEFHAISVADPANPVLVGSYIHNFGTESFCITGDYAYITRQNEPEIVDIHKPEAMQQAGHISSAKHPDFLVAGDGYVYGAQTEPSGLAAWKLANPTHPSLTKHIDKMARPRFLATANDRTYVHDDATYVKMLDTTVPESAKIIQVLKITGGNEGAWMEMAIDGDVGCVLRWGADWEVTKFYTLDLSNPDEVEIAVNVEGVDEWMPRTLDAAGGYAYLGGEHGWLIVDIDPPADAHIVASWAQPSDITGVTATGQRLYIIGEESLIACDISDPANPAQLGQFDLAGWDINGFTALDNYVYLSQKTPDSLHVIDATDPADINVTDVIEVPFCAGRLRIMGGYLYTAGEEDGIGVFDIYPPGTVEAYSNLLTLPFFSANYISCDEGYIYFASGGTWQDYELRIYKWW